MKPIPLKDEVLDVSLIVIDIQNYTAHTCTPARLIHNLFTVLTILIVQLNLFNFITKYHEQT